MLYSSGFHGLDYADNVIHKTDSSTRLKFRFKRIRRLLSALSKRHWRLHSPDSFELVHATAW